MRLGLTTLLLSMSAGVATVTWLAMRLGDKTFSAHGYIAVPIGLLVAGAWYFAGRVLEETEL